MYSCTTLQLILKRKYLGIEHHTDALGYLVMAEFPLVVQRIGTARIVGV